MCTVSNLYELTVFGRSCRLGPPAGELGAKAQIGQNLPVCPDTWGRPKPGFDGGNCHVADVTILSRPRGIPIRRANSSRIQPCGRQQAGGASNIHSALRPFGRPVGARRLKSYLPSIRLGQFFLGLCFEQDRDMFNLLNFIQFRLLFFGSHSSFVDGQ